MQEWWQNITGSLGSSGILLSLFFGIAVLIGLLYQSGVLGWAVRLISGVVQKFVEGGYLLWRIILAWAPWPVLAGLVVVLAVPALLGMREPALEVLSGIVLVFVGVTTCLAYIFLDQERVEVSRGYKVLHNPFKGQELAVHLLQYGHRMGAITLITAAVAVVWGFTVLNLGLYDSVGRDWYRVAATKNVVIKGQSVAAPVEAREPDVRDFFAFTLLHVSRAVDILDIANSYNYTQLTYVQQNRWPASTLLILFKSFFTLVLLQQVYSALRSGRELSDATQDFWSPHEPIRQRAQLALVQHGAGAVRALLWSLREVPLLTSQQREDLAQAIAAVGPAAVPILLRRLRSPHESERAVSVLALGRLQEVHALDAMVRMVDDPSEQVRLGLLESLQYLFAPGPAAVRKQQALRGRGQERGWRRYTRWVRQLRHWWGRPFDAVAASVLALRKLLHDPQPLLRAQAARALAKLKTEAESALPDLIDLLQHAEESVQLEALYALGQVGGAADVVIPALLPLLQSPSAAVRASVAQALGARKHEAAIAVPDLVSLVHDSDEKVREAVAEALKQLGPASQEAGPQLVEALASKDDVVRAQAASTIGTIGAHAEDTVPALIRALGDVGDEVRENAAEALGGMGAAARAAIPALTGCLGDSNSAVITQAALALGALAPIGPAGTERIILLLEHNNPQVRATAARVLGKLPEAESKAVDSLIKLARDPVGPVRAQAILALASLCPGGGADWLNVEVGKDPDPQVRAAAVTALAGRDSLNEGLRGLLLAALSDTSDDVKMAALDALAGTPALPGTAALAGTPAHAEESLPLVCRLLHDDQAEVQLRAAKTLAKMGPAAQACGAAIADALQTAEGEVRDQLFHTLAVVQPPEAVALFLGGLQDSRAEVRKLASAGLMKAKELPAEVVQALADALRDPEAQVRSNAASALANQSEVPGDVVPSLLECLNDLDDGVRINAMRALKNVSEETHETAQQLVAGDPNPRVTEPAK